MSIICTDLPSTLQVAHCYTFPTGFTESQRATEGNCFNFCVFATCSFFQTLKNASSNLVKNLSWQSFAEELISNGQYWRWRRWWPIGHPRRRCLKLNLGFNWRGCSPFTRSVHFTPSTPVFNIDQCCSHPLPPPMFNIDQLGCQIVQARTASSGMFSEHWSHL